VGTALDALIELLDLEAIEVNIFRGLSPDEQRQRVFGGQVAGQALVAAGRTVDDDKHVHSLHAYFLRPGDPTVPILYEVDRIRDGRSFTTRRVVGIQHGRAIFNLAASFHIDEPGPAHQVPMPDVPDPESLPTFRERMEPYKDMLGEWYERDRPLDSRHITRTPLERAPDEPLPPRQQLWFKTNGELPDDPLLHACIVAYESDFTLLDTALLPIGIRSWNDGRTMMASLDHAMWFHRPFRADEWLLYSQSSPSASGGRGLAMGAIFRRDGTHAVSVVQEGLIRPVDPARVSAPYKG
jgi:acyl-CoA thioesterase-2